MANWCVGSTRSRRETSSGICDLCMTAHPLKYIAIVASNELHTSTALFQIISACNKRTDGTLSKLWYSIRRNVEFSVDIQKIKVSSKGNYKLLAFRTRSGKNGCPITQHVAFNGTGNDISGGKVEELENRRQYENNLNL